MCDYRRETPLKPTMIVIIKLNVYFSKWLSFRMAKISTRWGQRIEEHALNINPNPIKSVIWIGNEVCYSVCVSLYVC